MGKKPNSLVIVPPIIATMGFWLLFAGSFSFHELVLGAAFTVFTALVTSLAWHNMGVLFFPTFRQVVCVWRLPWYVLHDSVEISVILAKDLTGVRAGSHFRAVGFPSDSEEHDTARAVLATTATTMTPSMIVLGVANDCLLFHQLQRSPLPRMISDLEAR